MTQTLYQPGMAGETLVGYGENNVAVGQAAIAAGVVVIKAAPGRLCCVLVTTATTASQAITFYDNATAGSGTVIGVIPGGTTAGTVYTFLMPANNGITIGQNASLAAGQITVSFS
jgi:hypothetical protein